jgi:acetyl-CoA carboxylase biotin carboxylase subunit
LKFGAFVMAHPDFVNGKFDTHFVAKHFKPEYLKKEDAAEMEIAALLAAYVYEGKSKPAKLSQTNVLQPKSNWVKNRTLS